MWFELRLPIGCENKIVKDCCVEKTWIRLPGPDAIACLVCVERDRNFLPDLTTHFKVFGDLVQVTPELVRGRRAVKRRIISHGPE